MTSALDQDKAALRKVAKVQRKEAAQANPTASAEAMQALLEYLGAVTPRCLAGYLPIGSELDPQPALQRLHERGAQTALPVVVAEAQPLIFRAYQSGDDLITEAFATRAPTAQAAQVMPDLVLVPMLAFDRKGYRLGYGGGFYDRTIAQFQQKKLDCAFIGFAYAAQQVDEVPVGAYDLPLNVIITEQGVVLI